MTDFSLSSDGLDRCRVMETPTASGRRPFPPAVLTRHFPPVFATTRPGPLTFSYVFVTTNVTVTARALPNPADGRIK